MDRTLITKHLMQAAEHIALGERHIGRQKEIIANLQARGLDTDLAQKVLDQFEQLQKEHVSHRDWLIGKLADTAGPGTTN